MTVLSDISIRTLGMKGMIVPFMESNKDLSTGLSYGLQPASYDLRLGQDIKMYPRTTALGSTLERFALPRNVCAQVVGKSTLARLFIEVFNTHIDPGFEGGLTLELVNHSERIIPLIAGQPIAQLRFMWVDQDVEKPYSGKYQHQSMDPVGPILDHG